MARLRRNSISPLFALLIALAPALAGCSGEEPAPGKPPVEAIYGPALSTMLTPFPSDRYTTPDATAPTGLRAAVSAQTTGDPLLTTYPAVLDQVNELDGFSTSGGVFVSFTGPIDLHGIVIDETLEPPVLDPPRDAHDYAKAGSPFVLVDVDPKSPEHGKARGIVPRWWAQPKSDYYLFDEFTLLAQPATPLLPGTRYLFAVTKSLKGADGAPVARSAETERLLSGAATGAYAEQVIEGVKEAEASLGISRADMVLVTAFTTASVIDDMVALAGRARMSPPPALVDPWTVETPLGADGRVRFRATFEAPEYRTPKPGGKWVLEGGAPKEQKKEALEVFLAFSDGTKSGPRPVVIFQHGLGGDKDGCAGTSERLKALNAAVIAIDSPEHGARGPLEQNLITSVFGFFGIDEKTSSFDMQKARDNFRQMASDQLELVRFINTLGTLDILPVGAPDGVPDLDVSRVLYIGHSFGSVQGPTAMALAPEIKHAVWNVGGDNLTMLIRDSGLFSIMVNSLRPPGTSDGALARFFAVTQGIIDPGDPVNFARFAALDALPGSTAWQPRDVLIQEVIDDGIVPNSTSEALARAAGLTQMDPIRPISGLSPVSGPVTGNMAAGATGVISQFDKMDGDMAAEHGGLIFSAEAIAQYVEFFKTGLAKGHGTVPPAYPK